MNLKSISHQVKRPELREISLTESQPARFPLEKGPPLRYCQVRAKVWKGWYWSPRCNRKKETLRCLNYHHPPHTFSETLKGTCCLVYEQNYDTPERSFPKDLLYKPLCKLRPRQVHIPSPRPLRERFVLLNPTVHCTIHRQCTKSSASNWSASSIFLLFLVFLADVQNLILANVPIFFIMILVMFSDLCSTKRLFWCTFELCNALGVSHLVWYVWSSPDSSLPFLSSTLRAALW